MWCIKCEGVEVGVGEVCDECGHIAGEIPMSPLETARALFFAQLCIAELESAMREMQRSVPGGQIGSCQEIADELRAIALRHGVLMGDEAVVG